MEGSGVSTGVVTNIPLLIHPLGVVVVVGVDFTPSSNGEQLIGLSSSVCGFVVSRDIIRDVICSTAIFPSMFSASKSVLRVTFFKFIMWSQLIVITLKPNVPRIEYGESLIVIIIVFGVQLTLISREGIEIRDSIPRVRVGQLSNTATDIVLIPGINSPSSTAVVDSLVSTGGRVGI